MTAYTGQRWANCAPPYGTPTHGRLWYSLDSNQGVCCDASSTEMQCLRPLRNSGASHASDARKQTLKCHADPGWYVYIFFFMCLNKTTNYQIHFHDFSDFIIFLKMFLGLEKYFKMPWLFMTVQMLDGEVYLYWIILQSVHSFNDHIGNRAQVLYSVSSSWL
jgi:hypothetical protein